MPRKSAPMTYQGWLMSVVKLSVRNPNHFSVRPDLCTLLRPLNLLTILDSALHASEEKVSPLGLLLMPTRLSMLMAVLPRPSIEYSAAAVAAAVAPCDLLRVGDAMEGEPAAGVRRKEAEGEMSRCMDSSRPKLALTSS